MDHSQNSTYSYHCPGRSEIADSQTSTNIHFPEYPKIYPLDMSMEAEYRERESSLTAESHKDSKSSYYL